MVIFKEQGNMGDQFKGKRVRTEKRKQKKQLRSKIKGGGRKVKEKQKVRMKENGERCGR